MADSLSNLAVDLRAERAGPAVPGGAGWLREGSQIQRAGWQIPPPLPEPLPEDLDPKVRWAMVRMVPQPLATFAQPLRLTNPAGREMPRAYVLCTAGKEGQELPGYVQRVRSDPGGDSWNWRPPTAHT